MVEPGLIKKDLTPCSRSHNCVSVLSDPDDERYFISPISYSGTKKQAKEKLEHIIGDHPRTEILTNDKIFIHSVFKTRVFKFEDDVEFLIVETNKLFHFLSASKVGDYDFGTN